MKKSARALVVALTTACALCASPGAATAARTTKCSRRRNPLPCIAHRHRWGSSQQHAWWEVLMRESGSSRGHWNLTASNGSCYGMAQFIGGPQEYYALGGNPYSAYGQLVAMARYIAERYGSPAAAWYSEVTRGFY